MAGFVDLDQRLCGCLIVGRGASYCAGDVSRNEGVLLAAWANRAYGDDTGRLAGISDNPGRFWVPWGVGASSCWCAVWQGVCRVVTSRFAVENEPQLWMTPMGGQTSGAWDVELVLPSQK